MVPKGSTASSENSSPCVTVLIVTWIAWPPCGVSEKVVPALKLPRISVRSMPWSQLVQALTSTQMAQTSLTEALRVTVAAATNCCVSDIFGKLLLFGGVVGDGVGEEGLVLLAQPMRAVVCADLDHHAVERPVRLVQRTRVVPECRVEELEDHVGVPDQPELGQAHAVLVQHDQALA